MKHLNIRQRFVVWLMASCILLVLVYPPWWGLAYRPASGLGFFQPRDWFFKAIGPAEVGPPRTLPATFFDTPRPVLDSLPPSVSKDVKADAWDTFYAVHSSSELRSKLRQVPIPDSAKTDLQNLWTAQFGPKSGISFWQLMTEIAVILLIGSGLLWVLKTEQPKQRETP